MSFHWARCEPKIRAGAMNLNVNITAYGKCISGPYPYVKNKPHTLWYLVVCIGEETHVLQKEPQFCIELADFAHCWVQSFEERTDHSCRTTYCLSRNLIQKICVDYLYLFHTASWNNCWFQKSRVILFLIIATTLYFKTTCRLKKNFDVCIDSKSIFSQ